MVLTKLKNIKSKFRHSLSMNDIYKYWFGICNLWHLWILTEHHQSYNNIWYNKLQCWENSDTNRCGKYQRSSSPDKFFLGHTDTLSAMLNVHFRKLKQMKILMRSTMMMWVIMLNVLFAWIILEVETKMGMHCFLNHPHF